MTPQSETAAASEMQTLHTAIPTHGTRARSGPGRNFLKSELVWVCQRENGRDFLFVRRIEQLIQNSLMSVRY